MMGLLLIFEFIRPFHYMSKDGPLSMILWGVGATVAIIGFFVQPRAITLGVAALLANLIPPLWRRRGARTSRPLDFDLALVGAAGKSDRAIRVQPDFLPGASTVIFSH